MSDEASTIAQDITLDSLPLRDELQGKTLTAPRSCRSLSR